MAQKLYEESNIQAIADAIRAKNGTEDTYKTSEMADAIEAIPSGGNLPEEAFVISGDCSYRFAHSGWDWFIENYGDRITTENIKGLTYFLYSNEDIDRIPFELNFATSVVSIANAFNSAEGLLEVPKMNNCKPTAMDGMFNGCKSIRNFPEDLETWFDWSHIEGSTSAYTGAMNGLFENCYSMRKLPTGMFNHCNPNASYTTSYLYNMCRAAKCIDEILNIPINFTSTWTSNALGDTAGYCYRLKNFTFATPDGQPYVMKWKSQVFNFTNYVGWVYQYGYSDVLNYNSGITEDKEVTDDATYQALKDDPDWFTCDIAYSRYNHDSAVATINSLPDTSEYLATQSSGTNTIKFKGAAGSATDGGAIDTLTEEEIAVATAKGWTVTLV